MTEEKTETAIEKTGSTQIVPLPPPSSDVVVLARNPEEMEAAQQGLLVWADRKIEIERAQLTEAEENLARAKKMKVRTQGWARQVTLGKNRVLMYEKVKGALEQGFCIVPDFPVHVIAVRTSKADPPKPWETRTGTHYSQPTPPEVKYEQLPEGEGEYVGPDPRTADWQSDEKRPDGETRTVWKQRSLAMAEVDFPFKLVRPEILADLDRAMQLRIFDEIGVLPDVHQPRRRHRDPMIIGRIRRREGAYNEPTINFLITWWVDTRTL